MADDVRDGLGLQLGALASELLPVGVEDGVGQLVSQRLHLLALVVANLDADAAKAVVTVAVHLTREVVLLHAEAERVGDATELGVPVIRVRAEEPADRRLRKVIALGLARCGHRW